MLINSSGGRRDERDLSGFDYAAPQINVLEPVSTRRQYYEWPVASTAAAAEAPISAEYVSLFDRQPVSKVRQGVKFAECRLVVSINSILTGLGISSETMFC